MWGRYCAGIMAFVALLAQASQLDRTFFYHRTGSHDIIAWYTPADTPPLISHHLTERAATVRITIPRGKLSEVATTKAKALLADLSGLYSKVLYDTAQEFIFTYNPRQYAISVYTNNALGRFNCLMIAIERLHERSRHKKIGKTIVIDPGHGGHDAGAVNSKGIQEKDIALGVGLLTAHELEKRGFCVYLTRHNDTFIELDQRTGIANGLADAVAFVSIHANSAPRDTKKGFELLFPEIDISSQRFPDLQSNFIKEQSRRTALSIILAKSIGAELQQQVGTYIPNRGRYGTVSQVLTGTAVPAVLVELGYLSNPQESGLLTDPRIQELQAVGIAEGIARFVTQLSSDA